MRADIDIHTIRIFLHVLGVAVWVGGQFVMLGLLPALRASSDDGVAAAAARGFRRVAWPAFGLAFVTGIWNIFEVDMADAETSYSVVFGIKFLLVLLSGGAAFLHARTSSAAVRGLTGGLGFVAAVVAMLLGFAMAH